MKKHTIEDLNRLYSESVSADNDLFAEQRSNVLLVAGNHYSGKGAKDLSRVRDLRDVPADVRLRLTKNHLSKICKTYLNNLMATSPGVQVIPRNEQENQDRKCAQLSNAVWQYGKDEIRFDMKLLSLAKDFVDIGECATKTFWNPHAGTFKGYAQAVDPMGQPAVGEDGQPAPDTSNPIFSGRLEIERILPTNLLRDAGATNMDESPWIGCRKMVPQAELKSMVGEDPDKIKLVEPTQRDAHMVFDANTSAYSTVKDQVLVIEYYFRPCAKYPMGYYYITTKAGILFEGELPYGVFPINYEGFDSMPTSARHRSIIKQLRPYQMEINRTASKIAEHQVTSDDKILVQSGTKLSSGGVLPGVRAIQYSGMKPEVLEGRTGAQYVEYMNGQIAEMYQVANIAEDMEMKPTQSADPYGLLFRSVKDQKKFSIYAEKFQSFLIGVCRTYLTLAKKYYTDEMLIPAIGKAEYINIAEFRSTEDIHTQIKVVPMSDDINTMFGKWLAINHVIQYAGQQLGKEDIGRLVRNVPYGNFEESFSDVTINYDIANNFMLALERGEWVEPQKAMDKAYMLKRLNKRMLESDYVLLAPNIKQMYQQAATIFEKLETDEKLAIQRAEQGFIPTGGPLIKTDLQVQLPNSTGGFKTTRAAFPVEALSWLQKQLEVQGSNLQDLNELPQAAQASVARTFNERSPAPTQGSDYTTLTESAQTQGVSNGIGSQYQSGNSYN